MRFAFFLLLSLQLSACCTKKECLGADFISDISFFRFRSIDLDSIAVSSFTKNTNLAIKIDSFVVGARQKFIGDTTYYVFLNKPLNFDADYRIIILKTKQHYIIKDFDMRKEQCNNGFLCQHDYNVLFGYTVNGKRDVPFDLSLRIIN